MADETITQLLNLLTVVLAVTLGARVGFVVASRGMMRDIYVIERHLENGLVMSKHQHEMDRETEHRKGVREELKQGYTSLARWLRELERTFDEIRSGAQAPHGIARGKAEALMARPPWEAVAPPVALAPSEMYWSSEVRALLRKFLGPYIRFVQESQHAMQQTIDAEGERVPFDLEMWEAHGQLISVINEVRDQMKADLSAPLA